jgi:hypothetical protein
MAEQKIKDIEEEVRHFLSCWIPLVCPALFIRLPFLAPRTHGRFCI